MHTSAMRLSRSVYLAGMVLALVLVVPTAWFPFQLLKVAAFAVCLLVSALLYIWGGGVRQLVHSHGLWGVLLIGFLPVTYILSMAFAVDRSVAITGYGIETDTLVFVILATLAFIFAFAHFRTLRTTQTLLTVLFWSLVAAAVFQFVNVVFGSAAIPLASFADRSANLVGKWNDLGILVGLLVLMLMVRIELSPSSPIGKIACIVGTAALMVLLALINFGLVWGLLLAAGLVVALLSFVSVRKLPWVPLVVAAISIIFLVYGSSINAGLTQVLPVSSLEIRPSYQTTLDVVNAARAGSFTRTLVGTGPNTFGQEWLLHKPAGVNQSQFWSLDFNVGYSTLTTAFGSVGLLGALAWLIPVILLVAALLRAMRMSLLTREDRTAAVSAASAALFLWVALALYVPSSNLIILAFVVAGAAFGFLWRQGQAAMEEQELPRLMQWGAFALLLVLVGLSAWSAVASSRRLVAEAYVGQGSLALQNNDSTGALAASNRAVAIDPSADSLRFALIAHSASLSALTQSTSTSQEQLQKQFSDGLKQTLAFGQSAIAASPNDYRPVLALAQLYDGLSQLKIQGADAQARSAYVAAAVLNPSNPQIPLLRARFEALAGNGSEVQKQIQQSLTLKPNYTDAMLFVEQLAVANNDLNTAVQAAQAAVQTAPGVPSLWFQLGLLLYTGRDTKDAITALGHAVQLQPDYANAQYFLGLSYYAQGQKEQALAQFNRLAQTNPDNAEVKLIIANMQAGKQNPFDGEQTTPPQQRATAPVAQ